MNHGYISRSRIRPFLGGCASLLALVCFPAVAANWSLLATNTGPGTVNPVKIEWRPAADDFSAFGSWSTKYNAGIAGHASTVVAQSYTGASYHLEWRVSVSNVVLVVVEGVASGTNVVDVAGPADTYYTNNFAWGNGTLSGRMVQANGNSPIFPQTFYAGPNSSWEWHFITTNVVGWMTIDDVDGPYHADLSNDVATAQNYVPPTANGSGNATNVLWSGDTNGPSSGLALDSTLREGFGTLYTTLNDGFSGVETSVKDSGNQIVNALNAKTFSANITNENNITVTGVFNGLEALNAISNMMANSGDDGAAASNNAPWMFNGTILDKANTEAGSLRTASPPLRAPSAASRGSGRSLSRT